MTNDNPYGSTTRAVEESDKQFLSEDSSTPLSQYTLLGLRLLGVMFLVDGAANLLGSLTTIVIDWRQLNIIPDTPEITYYDAYTTGSLVTYLLYMIAGTYLLLNPRPLMNLFFLPASRI